MRAVSSEEPEEEIADRQTSGRKNRNKVFEADAGTDKAPWLALSVEVERGAKNPMLELRRQYDRWRRTQLKEPARLYAP